MAYYWIVAQHSGKVLDVYGESVDNSAKIIQYTKKSGNNPTVSWIYCSHYIFSFVFID